MSLRTEHARELRHLDQVERSLARRLGAHALLATFLAVAAAIALPASLRETERPAIHALAAAPLAAAAALALRARAARRELDDVRSRRRAVLFEIAGVPPGSGEAPLSAAHRTAARSAS